MLLPSPLLLLLSSCRRISNRQRPTPFQESTARSKGVAAATRGASPVLVPAAICRAGVSSVKHGEAKRRLGRTGAHENIFTRSVYQGLCCTARSCCLLGADSRQPA